MVRHTKKMMEKAKKCKVVLEGTSFRVYSPSGSDYVVNMLSSGENEFSCTCKFCSFHKFKICPHKLAVILWLEDIANKNVSAWANKEDAKRQHRHTEKTQDVYITTRRKAA